MMLFLGQVDRNKMPVYIIDIDYNKYLIGYECKYDEATKKRHGKIILIIMVIIYKIIIQDNYFITLRLS